MSSPRFAAWLAATPLWLVALSLLVLMLAAALLGYALRQLHKRRLAESGQAPVAEEGFVLSSVLGLLALLIGFTFALAIDRFETRRALVLEEANAIGTAYLRAQLLDEPHRARISRLLVAYTDNRLEIASQPHGIARALVVRNDRLANELWVATVAAWPTIRGMNFSSAFIDSMNAVIDLNESRKVARQAKVPYEVYLVLFVYIIATVGLVGYTRESGRERWAATFLFLLLTLSLVLIIDIDRPASGGINESQRPMEDLQAMLRASPPETFGAPVAAP
ncbi:MAG TPA: hypothetical protein VI168_18315 [Croceibacterium sp.]